MKTKTYFTVSDKIREQALMQIFRTISRRTEIPIKVIADGFIEHKDVRLPVANFLVENGHKIQISYDHLGLASLDLRQVDDELQKTIKSVKDSILDRVMFGSLSIQ